MAEIVGREVLLKDENGEVIVPYVGYASQGRNIGDIFYTSRLDTELNGAFECNGGTYSTGDFSGNQSIGNLLSGGKLPYVSLAEYESVVTANGSCRAFGWDGGTSFRVPTLKDVYIEAGTASSAGEFISESLPNIKGSVSLTGSDNAKLYIAEVNGVFYTEDATTTTQIQSRAGSAKTQSGLGVNASLGSSTYQDGAKVKPDSVRYRAMVQLAISTTDDAVITATSALQQISNKADVDLGNLSTDGQNVINSRIASVMENVIYNYAGRIQLANQTAVQVPANGLINYNHDSSSVAAQSSEVLVSPDNVTWYTVGWVFCSHGIKSSVVFPITEGWYVKASTTRSTMYYIPVEI
jgi:hypothetical protein